MNEWDCTTILRIAAAHRAGKRPIPNKLLFYLATVNCDSTLTRIFLQVLLDYSHSAAQGTIGAIQEQKRTGRWDMKVSRILVVDDYKPWRQKICSLLKAKPEFRVVAECWNGADAVERAGELKPNLITLDIGIPELNGIEVAVRVAEVSPTSKILFISASTDPEVVSAAIDTGASGYLHKMRVGTELLPAVTSIIRGGCFFSPYIEGSTAYREPADTKEWQESTEMQIAHSASY